MIEIREEQPDDIQVIREINVCAFGQPQEADIVDKLRTFCNDVLSLVAITEDNHVVGQIFFSPAIIVQGKEKTVEGVGLAPMAVFPEYQRQGVGLRLVKAGLAILKDRGCPFVIVLGHPEYYPRFGFKRASCLNILSEWDVPDEAFMILVLNESKIKEIKGLAKYRPEFNEAM